MQLSSMPFPSVRQSFSKSLASHFWYCGTLPSHAIVFSTGLTKQLLVFDWTTRLHLGSVRHHSLF